MNSLSWLRSFFLNLGDAAATGGDREAFNARRGARLQNEGRDSDWNRYTAGLGQLAVKGYERAEKEGAIKGPRDVQYANPDFIIKVKSGYSRDKDSWTTDVFVIPRGAGGGHWHVVFDEKGNIIHNGWRDSGSH